MKRRHDPAAGAEIRPDAVEAASSTKLEQVEREHILRVLRETGGVVSQRHGYPSRAATENLKRSDAEAGDLSQGSLSMPGLTILGHVTIYGYQASRHRLGSENSS